MSILVSLFVYLLSLLCLSLSHAHIQHISSAAHNHHRFFTISNKELPPTKPDSKKPLFVQAEYGFLAFITGVYAIASLKPKETIIASEDTPSSCEQAFIRATKICVVPYTAHIPSILMQFDNIIWHSTSHITPPKDNG